jgi:hypothetical protein
MKSYRLLALICEVRSAYDSIGAVTAITYSKGGSSHQEARGDGDGDEKTHRASKRI